MKNILVPIDFSLKSLNAISLVKRIAKKMNAKVHLVHVIETVKNYPFIKDSLGESAVDDYLKEMGSLLTRKMRDLSQGLEAEKIETASHLKVGVAFSNIKRLSKEVDADFIIIGAKGLTNAEEFFLGSLTDKVVRSISVPVFTVKEIGGTSLKNIVYATDLKKDHEKMLNLLCDLQNTFGSTLHIVKVNTRKNFKNEVSIDKDLLSLAKRFDLKDYTLNSYCHEDEEYGIVYFADKVEADVIALGVNEKSGIRRLISGGSISNEVTEHTFRPVLTYHFSKNSGNEEGYRQKRQD
ncbi:MAG: universal stress protein [Bacteroidota bacterium]